MAIYQVPDVDLSVEYCGLRFENPFILASAPPSDTYEMVRDAFRAGWAGAVLKTTSMEDYRVDIAYPCIAASRTGGQVMGLGNIDNISEFHMDEFERAIRLLKAEFPAKIVATSIWGTTKESWQTLTRRSIDCGADYLEVSMSCPTDSPVEGLHFMIGQIPEEAAKIVSWIVEAADGFPVVPKLTGDVTHIVSIARAVKEAGATALCACDSRHGLIGVDLDTFAPLPNIVPHSALRPIKHAVAQVDKSRCTRCGRCVISCNDGGHRAYVVDEAGYPTVDSQKCYGCGLCPDVCPADCIRLVAR